MQFYRMKSQSHVDAVKVGKDQAFAVAKWLTQHGVATFSVELDGSVVIRREGKRALTALPSYWIIADGDWFHIMKVEDFDAFYQPTDEVAN
ncbi:MAG TPA: hypothetical protein VMJ31_02885 [Methylocystis sp.]|nr:hypothetical protein [Methylocystis sp.]